MRLPAAGIQRYDLKGNVVKDTVIDGTKESQQMYEKYGKRLTILGWHEIRQLLFEYLPSATVEFDKQVRC